MFLGGGLDFRKGEPPPLASLQHENARFPPYQGGKTHGRGAQKPFGGSVTTVNQKTSMDFTTTMNFSRSTGFVT